MLGRSTAFPLQLLAVFLSSSFPPVAASSRDFASCMGVEKKRRSRKEVGVLNAFSLLFFFYRIQTTGCKEEQDTKSFNRTSPDRLVAGSL